MTRDTHAGSEVDRKRAQQLILSLLDSAPDAMVVVGAHGRIALVNTQTEKLFGYKREELLGQPVEVLAQSFPVEISLSPQHTDEGARSCPRRFAMSPTENASKMPCVSPKPLSWEWWKTRLGRKIRAIFDSEPAATVAAAAPGDGFAK